MKTVAIKRELKDKDWFVVDAKGLVLGRLASKLASILSGKHKSIYTPNYDTGDYVVVLNTDLIHVTGQKEKDKLYYRHSTYPGGLKVQTFSGMQKKHPGAVLRLAVKGMLPKNRLARQMIKKLKIYRGTEHRHPQGMLKPLK